MQTDLPLTSAGESDEPVTIAEMAAWFGWEAIALCSCGSVETAAQAALAWWETDIIIGRLLQDAVVAVAEIVGQ